MLENELLIKSKSKSNSKSKSKLEHVQIIDTTYNIKNTIKLDLCRRQLNILPNYIEYLTNLQVLWLNNNQLLEINSIEYLTNLKYLYLSNNKLKIIPNSIKNLTNLQELYLNNNNISVIPKSIKYLTNLKSLLLNDNKLTNISSSLLKISNKLYINESSYKINNLDSECEFLLFNSLSTSLTNLPYNLKELWLSKSINIQNLVIKLPFGCEIKYF
jgi:leucine-rich repeat protein SHOC2